MITRERMKKKERGRKEAINENRRKEIEKKREGREREWRKTGCK